jgi:hypothetical protein
MIAGACALIVLVGEANAGDKRDTTYFCTMDAAGGVTFNKLANRWQGTVFREDTKFILRLAHLRHLEKFGPVGMPVDYYKVTFTREGKNEAIECTGTYSDRGPEVLVFSDIGVVSCTAGLFEYTLNLTNNRIMSAYLVGYVSGRDDDSDTPAIAVGKCTKIAG